MKRQPVKEADQPLRERFGPEIPCGCGCGQTITQFDPDGRERRFVNGHYLKWLHRAYVRAGGKMG